MSARSSALVIALLASGAAHSDGAAPPERVARIGYLIGKTAFQTAGSQEFEPAVLDFPMADGDKLVTARDARAEVSVGPATVHLDKNTNLILAHLDRSVARIEIERGTVIIQARELRHRESLEVQAREVKVQLLHPGYYRITASRDGVIVIAVRHGEAKIDTGALSFQQFAGEVARIAIDRTVTIARANSIDAFDLWSLQRQRLSSGERYFRHLITAADLFSIAERT